MPLRGIRNDNGKGLLPPRRGVCTIYVGDGLRPSPTQSPWKDSFAINGNDRTFTLLRFPIFQREPSAKSGAG